MVQIWVRRFLLLFVVLLCAACGGGGGGGGGSKAEVSLSTDKPGTVPGGQVQFTATVTGTDNTAVTWTKTGGSFGTVTGNTIFWIAPVAVGNYTITATTVDGKKVIAKTITVAQSVDVNVTALAAKVRTGGTVTLTGQATGGLTNALKWSVNGDGTVTPDTGNTVTFTAGTTAGTVRVRATSQDGAKDKFAEATIEVRAPVAVSVSPKTIQLLVGATQDFTATVANADDPSVAWTKTGGTLSATAGGTITYTAPTAPGTYTVRATSVEDPSRANEATVTVVAIGLSVSPSTLSLAPNEKGHLTATLQNAADPNAVRWSVPSGSLSSTTGGAVDYTAPSAPGTYTVSAASVQDPSKVATCTVTVMATNVSLVPKTARVLPGGTQRFTASVAGAGSTAVKWTAPGGGRFDNDAASTVTYTAPTTPGDYKVRVTSVQNPDRYNEATVTVVATTVTLDATTADQLPNDWKVFKATVVSAGGTGVTWSVVSGGGTIAPNGNSVACKAPLLAGTYKIRATAKDGSGAYADATITVQGPTGISVSPGSPTLDVNHTVTLVESMTRGHAYQVVWKIESGGGSLNKTDWDETVIYTAPTSVPPDGYVKISVTSMADPNVTTTVYIRIDPAHGSATGTIQ